MTIAQQALAAPLWASGTVHVGFGDGGFARWAGLSETELDRICAFVETIKAADTVT